MSAPVANRRVLPPRPAAEFAIAAEGARLLYRAGARSVWICGSLAHGNHWDDASDLDYATLGVIESARVAVMAELADRLGRSVDVITLEDAPAYVRVQITEAMVPIDRFGNAPAMTYGLLNPPVTTLTRHPLPRRLHAQRHTTVVDVLIRRGSIDILDAGCGSGELVAAIVGTLDRAATGQGLRATGIDREPAAIAAAHDHLQRVLTVEQRQRIELRRLDVEQLDAVWRGQDAIVAVEVLEHLSDFTLRRFSVLVFELLRPRTVVVTTPNAEFNALLPGRGLRDRDHRFEWRRDQFADWARDVARRGRYALSVGGIGEPHPDYGSPTQFAEFRHDD